MIVGNYKEMNGIELKGENIFCGVFKKILVSPKEGWEGYVMRLFELGPDGYSPRHRHNWPHINFVAEGEGFLHIDGTDYPLKQGSFAFVPSNALHQFKNTGSGTLAFVCIVPEEGDV